MSSTNHVQLNDFGLTPQDVVLAAISQADVRWPGLVEICKTTGAKLIPADPQAEAHVLAQAIVNDKITVAATTPEMWLEIYREVNNARRDNLGRIRALVFNGKPEPELRDHLMWHALPAIE